MVRNVINGFFELRLGNPRSQHTRFRLHNIKHSQHTVKVSRIRSLTRWYLAPSTPLAQSSGPGWRKAKSVLLRFPAQQLPWTGAFIPPLPRDLLTIVQPVGEER